MAKDTKRKMSDPIGENDRVFVGDVAEKLIAAAGRIYDYHLGIAFGHEPPEDFEKGNKDYQNRILEMVDPMIKQYEQTRSIDAQTSAEVVALLKGGKVSPKEAITLLNLVTTRLKVEEDELKTTVKKELIKLLGDVDASKLPKKQDKPAKK